jgi:hypothetical protein
MTTARSYLALWRNAAPIHKLLASLVLLHLLLLAFVPDGAEKLLIGDRGGSRVVKLDTLLEAQGIDGTLRALHAWGHPGDYVLFAPAYGIGGVYGMTLQSVLLLLVGVWFLYRLARLLLDERGAILAAAAYAVLPATLFHPHTIVTETVCNPLLIVAAYFVAKCLLAERPSARDAAAAGLALAVVGFVRPGFAPLHLALAALVVLLGRAALVERLKAGAVIGALALSLLAGWAILSSSVGSDHPRGYGGGELEYNFYLKAERMAAAGGFDLAEATAGATYREWPDGTGLTFLKAWRYVELVAEHPGAFLKVSASDIVNLVANPGVTMVLGRYLGLFDLGERNVNDYKKWRLLRESEGMLGLLAEIWRTSPLALVLNVTGFLAWGAFLAFAAIGGLRIAVERPRGPGVALLLWSVPLYVGLITIAAAGHSRWDHRSIAEPFLAIMLVAGLAFVQARLGAWRASRRPGDGQEHPR